MKWVQSYYTVGVTMKRVQSCLHCGGHHVMRVQSCLHCGGHHEVCAKVHHEVGEKLIFTLWGSP